MFNRLGTAATIATSVATLAVLLYIATGPALAILIPLVSAVAMAAWLRDDRRTDASAAVVPYLAVIVVSLLRGNGHGPVPDDPRYYPRREHLRRQPRCPPE